MYVTIALLILQSDEKINVDMTLFFILLRAQENFSSPLIKNKKLSNVFKYRSLCSYFEYILD